MNYTPWLELQCRMLPNVKRAAVVTGLIAGDHAAEHARVAAVWPNESVSTDDLVTVAALAAGRQSPVVSGASGDAAVAGDMLIANPFSSAQDGFAIIAIELTASETQRSVVMQLLNWGESWLRLLQSPPSVRGDLQGLGNGVCDVLEAACRFDKLAPSVTAIATSLTECFSCQRAAVGLRRSGRVALQGVSHSALFNARTSLVRSLEELMEECVENEVAIEAPADAAATYPTHQHFAHLNGVVLFSIPLKSHGEIVGALLLERRGEAFSSAEKEQLSLLANFLGALLETRRQREMSTLGRWREQLPRLWSRYAGTEAGPARYVLVIAVIALAVLLFGSGDYRVTAPARLEGSIQRAVVAPIDGFVSLAHARAGDTVTKGMLIAELDDRELKLEFQRLQNQRDEFAQQYRGELAAANHAQSQIVKAQIAQAEAELRRVQDQLQRTRLEVPFDGVIIEGDLSRSLGAPVTKGDVLFEIAPLDIYRVVLQVDERDVPHLLVGQQGLLYLNSQPSKGAEFVVEKVATMYEMEAGEVSYRTEARLIGESLFFRPGMQGMAKVEIGQRSYLWILFHPLTDWLKLKIWSWLP